MSGNPEFSWSKCPKCGSEKIISIGEKCCFSEEPYELRIAICECGHHFGYDSRNTPSHFGFDVEKEIPQGICCVCGHKLDCHLDEGDGWRCHSIATCDMFQCECYLRKDRCEDKSDYDMAKRVKEAEDGL